MSATAVTLSSIYSGLNPGQDSKKDAQELRSGGKPDKPAEWRLKSEFSVFKTRGARRDAVFNTRDQVYKVLVSDVNARLGSLTDEGAVKAAADEIWGRCLKESESPITLRIVRNLSSEVQRLGSGVDSKRIRAIDQPLQIPRSSSSQSVQMHVPPVQARPRTKTVKNPAFHSERKSRSDSYSLPTSLPAKPALPVSSASSDDKDLGISQEACLEKLTAELLTEASTELPSLERSNFCGQLAKLVKLAWRYQPGLLTLTPQECLKPKLVAAARKLLDYRQFMTPLVALHVHVYSIDEVGLKYLFEAPDWKAFRALPTPK